MSFSLITGAKEIALLGRFVTKGGATTASPFPQFVTDVAKFRAVVRTRDRRDAYSLLA